MKQKLFTGISLMAFAGVSFWACGDGSINKMDEADGLMAMQYPDHDAWVNFKEEQKNACKADMNCYIQYQGYIDGTELPTEDDVSSSSEEQQQQQPTRLSSAQGPIDIDNNGPTSSATVIDPGQTTTSSSSAGTVATGLGSCKPATSPINKGEQTAWTFIGNLTAKKSNGELYKPMDFGMASFVWDFGGLPDDGSASAVTSGKVTYNEFGPQNASVTVTMKDGATETIPCEPLQVNGAAITGCTCELVTTSVDIAKDANAQWKVSGTCASVGAEITGYNWKGTGVVAAADGLSATMPYTDVKQTDVPTLEVTNSETTVLPLPCKLPQLEDSDNPETNISLSYGDSPRTALQAGTIYHITYTDNRGSLVCFGTGTLTCGTSDPVTVGTYGTKVGAFSECGTVAVSADANVECSNTW